MVIQHPIEFSALQKGARLGPVHYTVDPDLAEAYSRATHMVPLSGHSGFAHPVFNFTDYLRLIGETFGSIGGGLHAKQSTTFHQPIPIGAPVAAFGEIVDLYERNGRDYWELEYYTALSDGTRLVTHRMLSTLDRPHQEQPKKDTNKKPTPKNSAPEPDGPVVEELTRTVTLEDEREFARQYVLRFDGMDSSAPQNLHTDQDLARSSGLPDVIGHAGMHYAWCSEVAYSYFGEQYLKGGSLEARFVGPVFPGDELKVSATRDSVTSDPGSDRLSIRVTSSAGRLVSICSAAMGQ